MVCRMRIGREDRSRFPQGCNIYGVEVVCTLYLYMDVVCISAEHMLPVDIESQI